MEQKFCNRWVKKLLEENINVINCVEILGVRSFFRPYFPTFGLNTERYGVFVRIQSKFGKMRTRKISNIDIFHAVISNCKNNNIHDLLNKEYI